MRSERAPGRRRSPRGRCLHVKLWARCGSAQLPPQRSTACARRHAAWQCCLHAAARVTGATSRPRFARAPAERSTNSGSRTGVSTVICMRGCPFQFSRRRCGGGGRRGLLYRPRAAPPRGARPAPRAGRRGPPRARATLERGPRGVGETTRSQPKTGGRAGVCRHKRPGWAIHFSQLSAWIMRRTRRTAHSTRARPIVSRQLDAQLACTTHKLQPRRTRRVAGPRWERTRSKINPSGGHITSPQHPAQPCLAWWRCWCVAF
jgi:hypothetical protein